MRAAYVRHAEDDDWGQARTLVRDVMDNAARGPPGRQHRGALLNGVTELVLERAFWYLSNDDKNLGGSVEKGIRDGQP